MQQAGIDFMAYNWNQLKWIDRCSKGVHSAVVSESEPTFNKHTVPSMPADDPNWWHKNRQK